MLFAFFIPVDSYCQSEISVLDSSICKSILNLDLKHAQNILDANSGSIPQLDKLVLLDKIELIDILINEDKQSFNKAKENRSKRLSVINRYHDKNEANWAYAELYLNWALLRMRFNEYIMAAWEFNKAKKCIEKIDSNSKAFIKAQKAAGLLHSIIGVIPEQYKWISESLGFKGNIKQGLKELNAFFQYMPKNSFFYSEGKITLSIIHSYLNEDIPKGIRILESLPHSLLTDYYKLILFNRSRNSDKFKYHLKKLNKNSASLKIPYMHFLNGLDHLYRFDTSGISYFQKYIETFKGNSYKAEAFQKMSWISLANNDTSAYHKYIYLAKNSDESQTDVDLNAKHVSLEIPDITLLKSRILFDGGFYNISLDLIKDKSTNEFKSLHDKTELVYRAARNFHKLGELKKAITYYKHTISYGKGLPDYFKGSAAYNMGNIYENQNEPEKAKQAYKQCLSFKNYPYKRSFDIKAKAGLQRLYSYN